MFLQRLLASFWHAVHKLSQLPPASASELFGCLACVFMAPWIALAAFSNQEILHDTGQLPALIAVVHAGHHPFFFSMKYKFDITLLTWPTPFNPAEFLAALGLQLAWQSLDGLIGTIAYTKLLQVDFGASLLRTAHHLRCDLACCIGGPAS